MFYINDRVWCPNCRPVFNRKWNRIGEELECTEQNYSGTSEDIGYCHKCKKEFFVSYKVDKITETSWN